MIPEELRRKVHLIEISTRKIINDVMSGNYKSHFKGQGVQFSEHRTYVAGDDIRHIDWKVSARTKETMLKKFEEERELTVFLIVDLSASGQFGSKEKLKVEASAEIGSLLAYAAEKTGDKIGALLFAGEIEKIIPPKKGKGHVFRIVRDILGYAPRTKGTSLAEAIDSANRIMKHAGVVFVISDFIAKDYESALRRLSKRHDVVAIRVMDGREFEIPPIGSLFLTDPETGIEGMVNTNSYAFKKWIQKEKKDYDLAFKSIFSKSRIEELLIRTREDYGEAVVRFFRTRARRRTSG